MLNVLELQKKLVAAALPSGFEHKVADVISEIVKPYVDEVYIDALGNVIAHKKGPGKKIMMPAHMDTIGFMATYIDDKGFIRVTNIGGISAVNMVATPVRFENGVKGIMQIEGKADLASAARNAVAMSNLFIDIGAKSKEEAEKLVDIGMVAVFDTETKVIFNDHLVSPYCDDLICSVSLILAMEQLKDVEPVNDLYYVFSTQEEVGLRGAITSAYHIDPDLGIALDVCPVGDTPAISVPMVVALGKGPTVKIKDASVICHPKAVEFLRKAAKANDIPYQNEILLAGGTDTAAIQKTRGGVIAGCISVPTRYIHSPQEMVAISDVENAAKLLAAAVCQEIDF